MTLEKVFESAECDVIVLNEHGTRMLTLFDAADWAYEEIFTPKFLHEECKAIPKNCAEKIVQLLPDEDEE